MSFVSWIFLKFMSKGWKIRWCHNIMWRTPQNWENNRCILSISRYVFKTPDWFIFLWNQVYFLLWCLSTIILSFCYCWAYWELETTESPRKTGDYATSPVNRLKFSMLRGSLQHLIISVDQTDRVNGISFKSVRNVIWK